jgi:hypothetical protein
MAESSENIALQKLADLRKSGKKMSASAAQKWLKQVIQRSQFVSKTKGRIGGKINKNSLVPGVMVTYVYDAKTKDKLPYWDKHPLIIVTDVTADGWYGINFHYLAAGQRLALLEALMVKTIGKSFKQRVAVSYDMLKGAVKYKWYRPCFKRYLGNHLKTTPILIPVADWHAAVLLPTQKFVGASRQAVYKDSLRIAKR